MSNFRPKLLVYPVSLEDLIRFHFNIKYILVIREVSVFKKRITTKNDFKKENVLMNNQCIVIKIKRI